jgi:hypothetical protein
MYMKAAWYTHDITSAIGTAGMTIGGISLRIPGLKNSAACLIKWDLGRRPLRRHSHSIVPMLCHN